ncbi:MAG: hypothetical protein ABFC96_12015 [Thermoguttaceae bacterium]
MARENQGLQIALIICIGLIVALGVTTYLGVHSYVEASAKLKTVTAEKSQLAQDKQIKEDDCQRLKQAIWGTGALPDDPTARKDEDMRKFGAGYPEESHYYAKLIEKMKLSIDERSKAVDDIKKDLEKRNDEFQVRETAKLPQIKKAEEGRDKAVKEMETEQAKSQAERTRITDDADKLRADLQKLRSEAKTDKEAIVADLDKAKKLNKKLSDRIDDLVHQIDILSGRDKQIQAALAEVVATNQREGTVWINLGRADSLTRQVTFAVYPASITNLTLKDKKGNIEVTQILGEHLAEARVLDDQATNPIVSGDKINTVLWSPGQQRHFALAGFVDIDGDHRSDLATVMNLIRANGGVVDAYIADSGKEKNKLIGEITVNTNYLVLGEAPNEKGEPGQLAAFSKMRGDADKLRTPRMQLGDMLQGMGWRNLSPVVRYGRGLNPNDFRPKAAEGESRKSLGDGTDAFEKREPPATRTPSSGYYRF